MTGEERNPTNAQDDEAEFAAFLKAAEEAPEPKAEAPQQEEAQEAPKQEAQTQAQESEDDWLSKVPDDVRERVRQEIEQREKAARDFENRWKAQSGQLAPTQKKVAELERQLREVNQRQAQEKPAGMSESAWSRYKREFAEESQAIEELVNPLREQLKTATEQLEEWRQEREFSEATRELAKQHPDWQQFDDDPVFGQWFDAQPDQIKRMFPDGQRAHPSDVAWLLSEFKRAEQVAMILEQQQQQPAATSSPKAAAVVARREQQKRDPVVGIRTGQSAPAGRRNATGSYPGEDEFAAFLEANPP
jgi:hypothetical protein